MRTSRYGFSDLNPLMGPVKQAAGTVRAQRRPVSPDNPFLAMEKIFSNAVSDSLNLYRDLRDWALESWFYTVFDNPLVKAMSAGGAAETRDTPTGDRPEWLERIDTGGFPEAVVRIMILLSDAGAGTRRRNLMACGSLADQDERLKDLRGDALKEMIRKQSCIVTRKPEEALATLDRLLPDREGRSKALSIAAELMIGSEDADPRMIKAYAVVADILGDQVSTEADPRKR